MKIDEIHEVLSNYQILWNPLESDGIHEVLGLKSNEIQWDLMKFMRF